MHIFLGPAGIPLTTKGPSTVDGIRRVAELGLNAMEVEFVRGVHMSIATAKEAGVVARDANVVLSIHAPYFINLCNPEKAAASKKRILDSCERAYHLGAWVVVFHPGFYGALEKTKAFEMVLSECEAMNETLLANGWDVKLGLETTGKPSQFGTLDETMAIHHKIKNCIPAVDFSHIFARDAGHIDFHEVLKKMEALGMDRHHCHFSGIEYTMKGERRHLTIDSNQPDFPALAKGLLKTKIRNITIISESPVLEKDSMKMLEILKQEGYAWKK
ncbi:MAG: TIM barrel protein [Candidatus Aenigmarchaeota archaeon]|nr:TIM barrel protein [Candidatus Aenigmarchaeota archaeon]